MIGKAIAMLLFDLENVDMMRRENARIPLERWQEGCH